MGLAEDGESARGMTRSDIAKLIAVLFLLTVVFSAYLGYSAGQKKHISSHETKKIYVCPDRQEVANPSLCSVHRSSDSTTTMPAVTTTTSETPPSTTTTSKRECITPPGEGCLCDSWACPEQSTTTTTCITIPYPDYVPATKSALLLLKDEEFKPNEVELFVGDTGIIILENRKGLYEITDTINNKTFVFRPNDQYIFSYEAREIGVNTVSCSRYCSRKTKAEISVVKPYKTVCTNVSGQAE